jgi:hypothetical protein
LLPLLPFRIVTPLSYAVVFSTWKIRSFQPLPPVMIVRFAPAPLSLVLRFALEGGAAQFPAQP